MNDCSEEIHQGLENLNEDQRKRQILLNELEQEMKKLRSKYLLKYEENPSVQENYDIVLVNPAVEERNEHICGDRKLNYKSPIVIENTDDEKNINDSTEKLIEGESKENQIDEYKKNINQQPEVIIILQENNFKSTSNNFMLSFNLESKETKEVDEFPLSHDNVKSQSNLNNQNNHNEIKLDAFDKAKEKLLQIKNELDDLDKYDFRSVIGTQTKKETEK